MLKATYNLRERKINLMHINCSVIISLQEESKKNKFAFEQKKNLFFYFLLVNLL